MISLVSSEELKYGFPDCGKETFLQWNSCNLKQRDLCVEDFFYDLAKHRIAIYPSAKRNCSKLCLLDASGNIHSHRFFDLPKLLPQNTMLIFNDSSVFKARLRAYPHPVEEDTNNSMEIFLLAYPKPGKWNACLGKPSKKLLRCKRIYFCGGMQASIRRDKAKEYLEIYFHSDIRVSFDAWLNSYGLTPLPPYIKRAANKDDSIRYQTIYGSAEYRSVAAPTAGLHFTKEMFANLKQLGVICEYLRLHVGGGTFLPVKVDALEDHRMHTESYSIAGDVWQRVWAHKQKGYPLVAVGTTTLRALESFAKLADYDSQKAAKFCSMMLTSDLFIYPKTTLERYTPWLVDGLITNFHAPKSTLLMLISALLGYKDACRVYDYALREDYRFLSYGDSSLLWLK